ncbi:MAG: BrnT family toxin [Magnetococcales bacterium]|nr:BrnT family toxin [Magnetococcales bacterium]
MKITYDPAKREKTLTERGLDFEDAISVFLGAEVTFQDDRMGYGESRFVTVGCFGERMTVMVWTPRDEGRRIISMRYANEREITRYQTRLG